MSLLGSHPIVDVSFRSFEWGELRVIQLFSRSLCSEQGAFCQTSFCGNVPEIAGFVDTVKVSFYEVWGNFARGL
jgi:hypothetical protein